MHDNALVRTAAAAVTVYVPDALDQAAAGFAAASKASATRRAYTADFRDFTAWADGQAVDVLPASARTVGRYLTHLATLGRSVSTIDRRAAAIASVHRAAGYDSPTGREEVRQILAGSRFVIDANAFYITANGSTAPAFLFDGYTLTIPSLRVTQTAILPGAASDRYAPLVQDIDCGASSSSWREIPGTAVAFTPDGLWSTLFSATAQAEVTAVGTNTFQGSAGLLIGIGVDGPPAINFYQVGQSAGNGGFPNVTRNPGSINSSQASFEMTAAGQGRRIALYYKFECTPGGSGKINSAQLKVMTLKR